MKVIIIAAMTADGFIGADDSHLATTWTSKEDNQTFRRLIREAGNMVMGFKTFMTIAKVSPSVFTKSIPGRRFIVYTSKPEVVTKYPEMETTTEDPAHLVKRLEKEGVKTLAVCGGASIYTQFMQAGTVDELYLDIEPVVFGQGVSLFSAPVNARLRLLNSQQLNDTGTTLHHYAVIK
jgi:dihydrofolate reductase